MNIRGKLSVIVDDLHLNASLLIEPDPHGDEWDLESIKEFLKQKGIVAGLDENSINEAMASFSRSGDKPVQRTVAGGKAPVAQPGPKYNWKIRPIPDDLSKDGEWLLRKAGEPHITRTKSRRVKIDKQIKKKSRFPLGKGQSETVSSWTTEEWEEQVRVDPRIEAKGWAEQGDVLAEITVSDHDGKMGQTVYGKLLAVPKAEIPEIYAGQGVEISRETVTALHDGFVRRGKNWVEILPFQHHRWSVSATRDRATCLLNFLPGKEDAAPPKAKKILRAARQKEFSDDELMSAEDLQKVLITSIHRQIQLKDYPLTASRDAQFRVEASPDRLRGLLSLRKGGGKGKPLVLKDVGGAIKKSGFKGMDFEKIKEDLLEFYRSRRTEMDEYVLAEGTPPTRGSDRDLTFLCTFVADDRLRQLREHTQLSGEADAPDDSAADGGFPSLLTYPLETVQRMAFVKVGTVVAEFSSADDGEEGKDVFGNILKGLPGNDPPLSIQENILVKKDEIIANEDGILDVIEQEGETILRVRPYREARISVDVSADRMQAFISLERARGFAPDLTVEQVNRLLEEKQVFKGIDADTLSDAILRARGGESIERLKIAEGSNPVRSENGGSIKFAVQLASGDKVTIKSNGRADFRAHDEITALEKDQLIAEIPSVSYDGIEGWDVSGNPVKAPVLEQTELNIGENVRREQSPDGTIRLYAEKSGELEYDGTNISVHVYHHVKGNVDMHTGNVKFPGDIHVKGNVERGFYVMAGGEILVAGAVDGALLSSGGSIQIAQGVIGAGKAVLRAKLNIKAQFAEESTLLAVGDIEIKNSCLRSNLKCNGILRLFGEKGTLIGGKVYTRHGIELYNLGNEKGTRTLVSFGQDYLVADQIEQHEKEVQRLKDQVIAMDNQMKVCEQRGQQKSLERVRTQKLRYLKMIEKRSLRLFTLRERYEEHFHSNIVIRGTLFPGVIIESHGRFREIHKEQKNVTVIFNEQNGRIDIIENKKEE